jgi:tetratricopeptide (TPR) repeat protein
MQEAEKEIAAAQVDVRAAMEQGLFQTAAEAAESCTQLCSNYYGEAHPATASAFNNLALAQKNLGLLDEALTNYDKALRIYRAALTDDHMSTAACYLNVGLLLLALASKAKGMSRVEHIENAKLNLEQAHGIRSKLLGDSSHPQALTVQLHLAAAARMQKRYADAERLLQDAIAALRKREVGGLGTATGLNNLGFLYKEMGQLARAGEAYEEAWRIREGKLGLRHPDTIAVMHNIAELRFAAGDEEGMNAMRQEILRRFGEQPGQQPGMVTAGAGGAATASASGVRGAGPPSSRTAGTHAAAQPRTRDTSDLSEG